MAWRPGLSPRVYLQWKWWWEQESVGEPLKQPGLPLARCPAHVRSRFPAPALTMQAGARRPGVGHARVGLSHARPPSPQGGTHRLDAAAVPGAPHSLEVTSSLEPPGFVPMGLTLDRVN